MKPVSYKRILAYLLDIIIVSFIGSLITYFIPVSDTYKESLDNFYELMGDMNNEDIKEEEYLKKINDLSYTISRESIASTTIVILISIGYYVIFVSNNDGQTLGKKIMKIKTTSKDAKKPLTFKNYLIRALLINSILVDTISLILILVLKKNMFLKVSDGLSTAFGVFYLVTFAMILFRNDGRGLHDILAGTMVVSTKEDVNSQENKETDEYEEATIIKEEKEEKAKPTKEKKMVKNEKTTETEKKEETTKKKPVSRKTKGETNGTNRN